MDACRPAVAEAHGQLTAGHTDERGLERSHGVERSLLEPAPGVGELDVVRRTVDQSHAEVALHLRERA